MLAEQVHSQCCFGFKNQGFQDPYLLMSQAEVSQRLRLEMKSEPDCATQTKTKPNTKTHTC